MRLPPQRLDPAVSSPQNEYYRALAAAALQEMRSAEPSKQLLSQSALSSPHLQFRQQQPGTQQQSQQLMQQMNDTPGPLLQLSSSRPQSPMDLGSSIRTPSNYSESDLHMATSPSMSGSFSLQGMLGRTQTSGPLSPGDSTQYANMLRSNQSALQACGTMQGSPQVLLSIYTFYYGNARLRLGAWLQLDTAVLGPRHV